MREETAGPVEKMLCYRALQTGVPISGSFELTPLCNLRCKMCYVRLDCAEQQKRGRLKTPGEWISLAEKFRDAGTLFLLLTGGEPLLYPGFRDVYLAARQNGLVLTVNTNGTMITEETARFFAENPPRRVNVTLYGAGKETYAALCGDADGYEKALRGIRFLNDSGVPVKISVSAVRDNRRDLDALFAFAEENRIPIEVDTCMAAAGNGRSKARLSPEDAARVRVKAAKRKLGGAGFSAYACQTVRALCENDRSAAREETGGMRCLAGRCSFSVDWQGRLRPCVLSRMDTVPILHNDVQTAWNTLKERVAAIAQNEACAACKLRPLCRACPAAAFRESGKADAVPDYICTYTKELYRLLCAESAADETRKKGKAIPDG